MRYGPDTFCQPMAIKHYVNPPRCKKYTSILFNHSTWKANVQSIILCFCYFLHKMKTKHFHHIILQLGQIIGY